jgi:hypothetical protein
LLELVRYIHLNPYRAGIPGKPEEYHWSSHRFYLGEDPLPWLSTEFVLGQFSESVGAARAEFRGFVADGMGADDEDNEFHPNRSDGRLIGDDQFIERVQEGEDAIKRDRRTLNDIIGSVCTVYNMKRTELSAVGKDRRASEARSMVALLVQEHPEITITEAAVVLHRDTSSLTAGAARLRSRLDRDTTLQDHLRKIEDSLSIPKYNT